MPKQRPGRKLKAQRRNNDPLVKKPTPLGDDETTQGGVRFEGGVRFREADNDDKHTRQLVEPKSTWKILKQAREQQQEENPTTEYENDFPALSAFTGEDQNDEEDENDEDYEDEEEVEDIDIDEVDEKTLQAFAGSGERQNLGDLIMQKINEKKDQVAEIIGDEEPESLLPEELVTHYTSVGNALSSYRAGKMPKTFKLIPRLTNWEDILDVMAPDKWSAAAMYQATRIFASNMSEGLVQRFYNVYLLPRVRDDIEFYKKLNFHLMQCLKKSLYKPAAFFRGILLPLCMADDTCTLREATIFCACLRENSIPPLHAAAAMLKIAELDYNGVNSLFLRVLVEKKYALPFRVLDAMVFHFLKFRREKRVLPVLWHQCFLSFVEIYAADISHEQKDALLELTKHQNHPQMTVEIRRQIERTDPRDVEMDEPPARIMEEMLNA